MTILLLIWIGASVLLCLAILGAAARPMPRLDEEVSIGHELALRPGPAAELEEVPAARFRPWPELPLPLLEAGTTEFNPAQAGGIHQGLPSTPVCLAAEPEFSWAVPPGP